MYGEIASGGMASVHFGRLLGAGGFSRTVAIKQLHAQFAKDPDWVRMFLEEARLVTRIRHLNVVPTIDAVATDGETFLIMEYVPGETLSRVLGPLSDRGERVPPQIACAVVAGVLHGLHAAHEAKDVRGRPLEIVHRDVSPHNVLIGEDGVPRVLDFGLAKATGRKRNGGEIKGTLAYMSPEQIGDADVTRSSDVYAAGVLLWEALTGRRLFQADNEGALIQKVLDNKVEPPSKLVLGISPEVDEITRKALCKDPAARFPSAHEMAVALDACLGASMQSEIAGWLDMTAGLVLSKRANAIAAMEQDGSSDSASISVAMPVGDQVPEDEVPDDREPTIRARAVSSPSYEGADTLAGPLPASLPQDAPEPPKMIPPRLRVGPPQPSVGLVTVRTRPVTVPHQTHALRNALLLAACLAAAMGIGLMAARIRKGSMTEGALVEPRREYPVAPAPQEPVVAPVIQLPGYVPAVAASTSGAKVPACDQGAELDDAGTKSQKRQCTP